MPTYKINGGLTLLHFLILYGYDKLIIEYFEKIEFDEIDYDFDLDYHPFSIALKLNNPNVLDTLAYVLRKKNCLTFKEELFFKVLKSASENFRKLISNTLFYHNRLEIDHLPETAILDPDKMPLCFKDNAKILTDEKLKQKIEKYLEDGEPVSL